ncbi:MAG: glycosyltransferase family 39 protein [Acidobacteriota bacterium]
MASEPVRGVALAFAALLSVFVATYRIEASSWLSDELDYRDAGLQYVHGDTHANREHPPLGKYVFGLAQAISGSSRPAAVRLPSATASVITGVLLFALARRMAGFFTGWLALVLWTVLPRGTISLGVPRIDRLAMLEPSMTLFVAIALWLGWRWYEGGSWGHAAGAGIALGLAAATKLTAVFVVPAILALPVVARRDRRSLRQSAVAGIACAATAAAAYLPLGREAPAAIRYMVAFQAAHNRQGHPMTVAGFTYLHPPWWSNLWWQWLDYGTLAIAATAIAVILGGLWAARGPFLYAAAATAGPLLYLSFGSGVKLPHYYAAWQAPQIVLLALSLGSVASRPGWHRAIAIVLALPLAWIGGATVARIAWLGPDDYQLAAKLLRDESVTRGRIVAIGSAQVASEYIPGVSDSLHEKPRPVAVVDDRLYSSAYFGHRKEVYDGFIDAIAGGATVHRIGHLTVYLVSPVPLRRNHPPAPRPPPGAAAAGPP